MSTRVQPCGLCGECVLSTGSVSGGAFARAYTARRGKVMVCQEFSRARIEKKMNEIENLFSDTLNRFLLQLLRAQGNIYSRSPRKEREQNGFIYCSLGYVNHMAYCQ